MYDRIAPLHADEVALLLENARRLLSKQFGVTVQTDHNGAWGRAGAHYVTLRYTPPGSRDLIELHMEVKSLRSRLADERKHLEDTRDQ